jgi:hypothetical protein
LAAATSAASAGNSATTAQTAATNSATSATNAASSATAAAGAAASIVSGLRRKTLNGNFSINQRNVTGTVVLAAGVYGHDRWKAGAAGCTYTFSTAGADTTLTITAGSLVQVIEGAFVEQAQHVMKWGGTSLGKISGGNYAASPVQLTATPGSNLTVEFGVGTLALVQVEPGVVPTTFERRPMLETTLCRWYYLELSSFYLFRTTATGNFGGGMETQTFAPMRTTPTLSYVFQAGNYNAPLFVIGRDYVFGYFASGSNVGDYGNYTLKLSAEI